MRQKQHKRHANTGTEQNQPDYFLHLRDSFPDFRFRASSLPVYAAGSIPMTESILNFYCPCLFFL